MSNKDVNQIIDEKLDKVSGGRGTGYASDECLPPDHGRHISKDEAINFKNKEVYFVEDGNISCYGWGTLINSVGQSNSEHVFHTVYVKGYHGSGCTSNLNITRELTSKAWTLYEKLA